MSKFKVGDRVKVIFNDYQIEPSTYGMIGTIKNISSDDVKTVVYDSDQPIYYRYAITSEKWGQDSSLELISSTTTVDIIAGLDKEIAEVETYLEVLKVAREQSIKFYANNPT